MCYITAVKNWRRPFLKALSAVLGNLSAAWFGVALITPNLTDITNIRSITTLTLDILLGIVFLGLTTIIERVLENEWK